jgi:predicted PurR-regulated permease PerM
MDKITETPFYQRLSFNLISIALIIAGLYVGKDIILPLLFSILLANLLLPLTNYLTRKHVNKTFSILLPLSLAIVISVGLLYFLSSQIINFIDDVPALQKRFDEVSRSFQVWFREGTSITIRKQNQYIHDTVDDLKDKAPGLMKSTVSSLTEILSYVVLIPLYTFLILYYRSTIKTFLIRVFKDASEQKVKEVLTESTTIAQKYLTGLLIETSLVFTLNMIGFLLLGIKYAVFLALLAALLNLIPYVGMLVANILCMTITLVSSDVISNVVWVGAILALVQFLDNNFGMPLIVGNKVRINALVTILGVLVGGALCGIPGMFLAIPGLAVLKVIFDKVPGLQPWGLLLGDNQTDPTAKAVSSSGESS